MEEAETVTAEHVTEDVQADAVTETNDHLDVEEVKEEKNVPLSALQKERKKRQESELKNQWLEEQIKKYQVQTPVKEEEDDSIYEAVTKKELSEFGNMSRAEIIREIKEEAWSEENEDKVAIINEKLTDLIKEKPHLTLAIQNAKNRWKESWDQLVGHGKVNQKAKPEERKKVQAPGSPASVPKSAGVTQVMDLRDMTDEQFNEWRLQKRRRRG